MFAISAGVSVTFKNVVISNGGGEGFPAIEDGGSVTIEKSTLVNVGPSLLVQAGASAVVRNSTISDGRTYGVVNDGTANFFNSSIVYNKEAGIENAGETNLTNTLVADNKGGDCEGKVTTSDHSLDSDGSCGVGALSKTSSPKIGKALQNQGGATPVHVLEAGSPAIGAGDSATCLSEDQRGAPRPGIVGRRVRHRRIRVQQRWRNDQHDRAECDDHGACHEQRRRCRRI